ncbi:MAG: GNAT family N-acetyltransferase [Acidobacteriota bacterium]
MSEITLRPMTEADLPFMRRVYAGTRVEELAQVPWSDGEKQAFLDMQFHAQHTYYQEHFADAAFDVIEADGEPVGRLYVDRREDEIRLIDIALLPEHRRGGIGGRLVKELLAEAGEAGLLVRIHVEQNNPAMTLYKRLGFRMIEEQGVYYLMEWVPEP